MIFVPSTPANPASAALPVSPLVAVRITISLLTLFFFADVIDENNGNEDQ